MQLRRLTEGKTKLCGDATGLTDLCLCGTSFWGESKRDLYRLCDSHGIRHTHGTLERFKTTHVVIPFTMKDLQYCQEYARHVLTSDKILKSLQWEIPIVSIDFLFQVIGKGCRSCCVLISGISRNVLNPRLYQCPLDCLPSCLQIDQFVKDTPPKFTDCKEKCNLKISEGEMDDSSISQSTQQGASLSPGNDCQTCDRHTYQTYDDRTVERSDDHHSCTNIGNNEQDEPTTVMEWHEASALPSQVPSIDSTNDNGTPLEATTPGLDDFEESDLRNFASIRVTPSIIPLSSHSSGETCSTGVSDLALQDSLDNPMPNEMSLPTSDCFIPGDLLARAPKGNSVRKRHNIRTRTPGIIHFTESMTFRHLGYMHVHVREKTALEIKKEDNVKLIVKPLLFYKVLGQDWMFEFKRYFTSKDIHMRDTSHGLELYCSTKVEGCSVHAITPTSIVVHRMPRIKTPCLPLKSTSSDSPPPYFYRYDYDPTKGQVLSH